MASKVWTMDRRSLSSNTGYVPQTLTLFEAAGFEKLIKPGDVVAIKLHCGEWNNSAYLRPVYARAVADEVKRLGGRPFVCDTTTMTYGPGASRVIAPDLMTTAERNGYNSASLGCPFLSADGFNGTDDVRIPLPEGYILNEAYVAKAIALADVMIALTHFKGHPMGVIGGAVKNLGIGCQSKRGKYNVHMGGHPDFGFPGVVEWHPENVTDDIKAMVPGICIHEAYSRQNGHVEWHPERCRSCLGCYGNMATVGAWTNTEDNLRAFNAACADACLAVTKALDGKIAYLNLGLDVSPKCDCLDHADLPVTPHLGIFASYDPVAVDTACLDKVVELPGMPGSAAEDFGVDAPGDHKLTVAASMVPGSSEETQLNTGIKNGLGTKDYELIEVFESDTDRFGFYDNRLVGERYKTIYAKENPFPADRHGGTGFDRKRRSEIDLDEVAGPRVTEPAGHAHHHH